MLFGMRFSRISARDFLDVEAVENPPAVSECCHHDARGLRCQINATKNDLHAALQTSGPPWLAVKGALNY